MRSSHSLDRLETAFDDDRLVPDAGLLLPAMLAQHLGLGGLVDGFESQRAHEVFARMASHCLGYEARVRPLRDA
jgi:hypothetical protein